MATYCWLIEYVTGLCSVGGQILKNTNHNLKTWGVWSVFFIGACIKIKMGCNLHNNQIDDKSHTT